MGKAAVIQHDYRSQDMYLHLHASPHSGTQPSSNFYGKKPHPPADKAGYHCLTLTNGKAVTDTMKLNSVTALPSHIAQFHFMVTSNP
jgi:hypothetical protein